MRFVNYESVVQNMNSTRNIEHFGKLLGTKPHMLGQVAELYKDLNITTLTDTLRNVFYSSANSGSKFQPIKSMVVEWEIKVNYIKKIYFAVDCTNNGADRTPVKMIFTEKYFDKNDYFKLENRQQLYVISVPVKVSRGWEYTVVLIDGEGGKTIDNNYTKAGKFARYVSNAYPEISQRGNVKYVSNKEMHRNYMTRHRSSISWSQAYGVLEKFYIEAGRPENRTYFTLNEKEKDCLDHYMNSREASLLFSETSFDQFGKCTLFEDGQEVPIGDGIVPQIERFASRHLYSRRTGLTTKTFEEMIYGLVQKCDTAIGNVFTIICNERLYADIQSLMKNDLRFQANANGAYYYSMGAATEIAKNAQKEPEKYKGMNPMVKVGAHFISYEFAGNKINFVVERAMSNEFHDRGYGIILDSGVNTQGIPNIQMHTLEGGEFISGTLNGMGMQDGKSSGVISTSTSASEYHLMGYGVATVYNPYKTAILMESIV